uniref:Uncharacterized protein n=1 Tax=Tolypothrix bouteillei VB521301 TaxID=1479485 RepID=A0A0C1QWV3_9CYAN
MELVFGNNRIQRLHFFLQPRRMEFAAIQAKPLRVHQSPTAGDPPAGLDSPPAWVLINFH